MNHSERIIHYIGAAVLLTVVGCIVLAGLGKTSPEWSGDVLKIGVGGLCGAVTAGGAVAYALKPKGPQDPTPKEKEEDNQ